MEPCFLGLDLGTTTVSASLVFPGGRRAEAASLPHGAGAGQEPGCQDPEKLLAAARTLLEGFWEGYGKVVSVGVTGQMHGILYLDGDGKPLSPLFSWQCPLAEKTLSSGKSALEEIEETTGRRLFAGYGLATHHALFRMGRVPDGAKTLLTAGDLFAMTLAGRGEPLLHPTNAASLGFFDREGNRFAGFSPLASFDALSLPAVARSDEPLGAFRGVPVSLAVGDNQASFLGSVREKDGVLLNLGTGGQISALGELRAGTPDGLEARPYFGGETLLSYATLAGGRAWAALEGFVRSLLSVREPVYPLLN
ncbi:MAG: sugar kinase, partial [Clostridia bacterium]|nr:sugar kinase [Clostridia bacterium]